MSIIDDLKALILKHDKNDADYARSEFQCRHAICVAVANHKELPNWARWEQKGVSYQFLKSGEKVWGHIGDFEILDIVIDIRIAQATKKDGL